MDLGNGKKKKATDRRLPRSAMVGTSANIVIDLPTGIYDGIGMVVQAHAILETALQELLFDLMRVDCPSGRVVLRYQSGTERFKTVRRMLDLYGITVSMNTVDLLDQIQECCDHRDQFAHSVWVRDEEGNIMLRLARGVFETPDGMADRSFLPEAKYVPDDVYSQIRENILSTIRQVHDLKHEVKRFFAKQPEASEQP
jgi:hypothetical protein